MSMTCQLVIKHTCVHKYVIARRIRRVSHFTLSVSSQSVIPIQSPTESQTLLPCSDFAWGRVFLFDS